MAQLPIGQLHSNSTQLLSLSLRGCAHFWFKLNQLLYNSRFFFVFLPLARLERISPPPIVFYLFLDLNSIPKLNRHFSLF